MDEPVTKKEVVQGVGVALLHGLLLALLLGAILFTGFWVALAVAKGFDTPLFQLVYWVFVTIGFLAHFISFLSCLIKFNQKLDWKKGKRVAYKITLSVCAVVTAGMFAPCIPRGSD
jgi:cellulose synthase/poly-beta-1,6-N-acetylglucosamine synthase-like glycosyltransferase